MGSVGREETLREFLDSIDYPVIVEGKNDALALSRLGVAEDDIVILNKGQTLLETIEALQGAGSAIILTDMDREGKGLRRKLLRLFSMYGIQENRKPRDLFAQLRLSHVEGL